MVLSPEEMRDRQIEMFGMTVEQVEAEKPEFYGPGLWAMSILSDVQELVSRNPTDDDLELARQWINKAKHWIHEARDFRSSDPRIW